MNNNTWWVKILIQYGITFIHACGCRMSCNNCKTNAEKNNLLKGARFKLT